MLRLARRIVRLGRATEPAAPPESPGAPMPAVAPMRGSLHVRQVDAGSCNACEAEFSAVFGPVYDGERFGVRVVASPRHADALVVTGPVTRNMEVPLRKTWEATPAPKIVIALGDCARNCGVFAGAYGVVGAVSDVIPVDLEIPGCPPPPDAILAALRSVTGT